MSTDAYYEFDLENLALRTLFEQILREIEVEYSANPDLSVKDFRLGLHRTAINRWLSMVGGNLFEQQVEAHRVNIDRLTRFIEKQGL